MIDYKGFIQDHFLIKNKQGEIVPFSFNDTQRYYYDLLINDYPDMQGVRENILKFRQPGISSLIDAILTVDFIMSELRKAPLTDCDIVSHKQAEAKVLFNRVDFFLDSFCNKAGLNKKDLLAADNSLALIGKRGSEMHVQTASAKVSGRGGTKQSIHWSEIGFYPNTEILNAQDLVLGAEQQVLDGTGKIFRESTGNISGDFFSEEYERGKRGEGYYKSRFFGWWIHKEYSLTPPSDWQPPIEYQNLMKLHGATIEQCYWHFKKIQSAIDPAKAKREYPTDDTEAFLMSGEQYFDGETLLKYQAMIQQPMLSGVIYV